MFSVLYDYMKKKDKKIILGPKDETVNLWLEFFDEDGNGVLDYEEYLDAITLLSTAASPERIKLVRQQESNIVFL